MARRALSAPGRGLLFFLGALLVLLAIHDLTFPNSLLRAWRRSVFSGEAPVEGVRDEMIDRLGIPR